MTERQTGKSHLTDITPFDHKVRASQFQDVTSFGQLEFDEKATTQRH